jgi:hypothetical protein
VFWNWLVLHPGLTPCSYYLLYGENIQAFPPGFRMIAGDTFQRNFTWPIPDPPKSQWHGAQASQAALKQKALGFNCLDYSRPDADKGTLASHYMPDKSFLDTSCPDGLRLEVMFPSCWNGEPDSEDHQSHVAYPSLVIDGTCPEGYEKRLVSLLYETIWGTEDFKDFDGKFVLSTGDPTGFGNHGDFMQGWEPGVLQEAVDKCTASSGLVSDCPVFHLQSDEDQRKCNFEVPDVLKEENVFFHNGIPGGVKIEDGPKYAFPIEYTTAPSAPTASPTGTPTGTPTESSTPALSIDLSLDLGAKVAKPTTTSTTPPPAPTTTSTPTPTPTPVTSYVDDQTTKAIVHLEREIVVGCEGKPIHTETKMADMSTLGVSSTTTTETVSTVVTMETPSVQKRDAAGHVHKRGHGHGHLHRRGNMF